MRGKSTLQRVQDTASRGKNRLGESRAVKGIVVGGKYCENEIIATLRWGENTQGRYWDYYLQGVKTIETFKASKNAAWEGEKEKQESKNLPSDQPRKEGNICR